MGDESAGYAAHDGVGDFTMLQQQGAPTGEGIVSNARMAGWIARAGTWSSQDGIALEMDGVSRGRSLGALSKGTSERQPEARDAGGCLNANTKHRPITERRESRGAVDFVLLEPLGRDARCTGRERCVNKGPSRAWGRFVVRVALNFLNRTADPSQGLPNTAESVRCCPALDGSGRGGDGRVACWHTANGPARQNGIGIVIVTTRISLIIAAGGCDRQSLRLLSVTLARARLSAVSASPALGPGHGRRSNVNGHCFEHAPRHSAADPDSPTQTLCSLVAGQPR